MTTPTQEDVTGLLTRALIVDAITQYTAKPWSDIGLRYVMVQAQWRGACRLLGSRIL